MAVEKIERVLGALSAKELLALEQYLETAYFSVPKGTREFGRSYLKARRSPTWPIMESSEKWKVIYGESPFQDAKWRKQKTFLLEWVEQFLILEQEKKEWTPLSQTNALLRAYYQRGLAQEFETLFAKAKEEFLPEHIGNERDVWEQSKLWEVGYNFSIAREDPHKYSGIEDALLLRRVAAFERFVMFDHLRTINGLENRKRIRKVEAHLPFPAGFVAFLQAERSGGIPLLESYAWLFDLLVEQKDDAVDAFLERLPQWMAALDLMESRILFDYAVNLLIQHYFRTPTVQVANKLFRIYQVALEAQLWRQSLEAFPLWHFKNICVVGCRVGEIKFVKQFMATAAQQLGDDEETKNTLGYCAALLQFEQGQYKECLDALQSLDMEHYMKLEIRMLEIKAWCERGEWELVETKLQSFERFLQRSDIGESRQRGMLSRIRVIRKIISYDPHDRNAKQQLQSQIEAEHVMDSEWLLSLLHKSQAPKP